MRGEVERIEKYGKSGDITMEETPPWVLEVSRASSS
jgi:hypothetical protein